MKRDMDLIREILRVIEERPLTSSDVKVTVPGHHFHEIGEHLRLMEDAGLVHGVTISSTSASCSRLTWQGHEFLDSTRKDTIWRKAKELALTKTGGLSFLAVGEAIKELVKIAISGSP